MSNTDKVWNSCELCEGLKDSGICPHAQWWTTNNKSSKNSGWANCWHPSKTLNIINEEKKD